MGLKKILANLVLDGLKEIENEENDDCCDCDECRNERQRDPQIGYPAPQMSQEEAEMKAMENWEPPSRYCVRAGGLDYWCDNWKSTALGLDVCWTQKIKGVEKPVFASLFENSFTIVDYDSPMTVEVFEHVKKQSFDYAMQLAQEAKLKDDVEKEQREKEKSSPHTDATYASYS